MPSIAIMYREPRPPSDEELAELRRLCGIKLEYPQYTLARVDLMTGPEVRRLITHLLNLPDIR